MCDPITIAGLALGAASTAANAAANSQAANAREDVLAAERIRQRKYDQEAKGINTASQNRYQDFSGQQDAKAQDLASYFVPKGNPADDPNAAAASVMPTSNSGLVQAEQSKQDAATNAFAANQGNALATYRSFGDLLGDTSRLQARDASLVGQIGGFKQGSSSIVPYELDAAAQKGQGLKLFGDILGGVGGLVGGMSGNPFASAAAPAVSPAQAAAAAAGRAPEFLAARKRQASLYPVAHWLGG